MITVTKNPVDDSDITIVSGVIETVKITKLKAPDAYKNTHKASLKIGDDWVNVSAFKSNRDNLTYQEKDKTWVEVTKGCEVKFVVSAREWNGKTYYEVKKSGLKVTKKATENASGEATNNSKPQGNATTQGSSKEAQTGSNSAKTTNGSAKTFKVYGTIKSIEEGVAVVVGEDQKEVQVILGEHGSEVSVGGRLTAQVDGEGNIKSGFKSYGSPKTNQKDDLPIRLGNAVTIANHFTDSYLDVVTIAKQVIGKVDELRAKMKAKYSSMDDYGLGSRCGQVAIIAAEKTKDINSFIKVAEELFIEICEAEQELREGKVVVEQKQDIKQEMQEPIMIDNFSSDVDISEPEDFDEFDEFEDIPFAPIGLQYRELLYAM